MSIKQIQALHYRTPYKLLRIREYNKLFDATSIGSLYRILSSKINRTSSRKFKANFNKSSYLYALGLAYDAGALACFATDEELASFMGLTTRHIINLRNILEDAKLIKTVKWKNNTVSGYMYTLGEVLRIPSQDGYSVGEEHEGLYIDKWYTWADQDELSFKIFLMEAFINDKNAEKENLAKYKAQLAARENNKNLASISSVDEDILSGLGKILPSFSKNPSENGTFISSRKRPMTQEKTIIEHPPIEVIEVEVKKDRGFSESPHTSGAIFDVQEVSPAVQIEVVKSEFVGLLRSKGARTVTLKEYIEFRKKLLTLGMNPATLKNTLKGAIPSSDWIEEAPSYGVMRSVYKNASFKKKLENSLLALSMDLTTLDTIDGVGMTVRKVVKDLAALNDDDRVLWSINRIVLDNRKRTALATNSLFLLKTFVNELAPAWNAYKAEMATINRKETPVDPERERQRAVEITEQLNKQLDKAAPEKVEKGWKYYDEMASRMPQGAAKTAILKMRNNFPKE